MIGVFSIGALVWRARALRFLMLFLLCWTGVRAVALWDPMLAPPLGEPPRLPWTALSLPANGAAPAGPLMTGTIPPQRIDRRPRYAPESQIAGKPTPFFDTVAHGRVGPGGAETRGQPGWLSTGRHSLRLALMARLLPDLSATTQRSAFLSSDASFGRHAVPGLSTATASGSPIPPPPWLARDLAGWSGAGWLFVRGGGSPSANRAGFAQLGGDQMGVRLGYGFGPSGRLRAYARGTVAPQQGGYRETAVGLAFAPLPHVPVDLHVEQRLAPRGQGRTAVAVMVSGGVSAVALPAGFELDAYAQAGMVGTRSRDGFVDAAASVEHDLVGRSGLRLTAGALAAGAAQPGAARLDVGPRLSLRLPEVGKGSRIALDWRQRIAGDARPASGLALTLAADF